MNTIRFRLAGSAAASHPASARRTAASLLRVTVAAAAALAAAAPCSAADDILHAVTIFTGRETNGGFCSETDLVTSLSLPVSPYLPGDGSRAAYNLRGLRSAIGNISGSAQNEIVTGAGGSRTIHILNGQTRQKINSFDLAGADFSFGATVAAGNFDASGGRIAVAPLAGGAPVLRILRADGTVNVEQYLYENDFKGGVDLTAGDFNGDNTTDIAAAPGPGRPFVIRIRFGPTFTSGPEVAPYGTGFTDGGSVTAGRFNSDNLADILAFPGTTNENEPPVTPRLAQFYHAPGFSTPANLTYGQYVNMYNARAAAADFNRDGVDDVYMRGGPFDRHFLNVIDPVTGEPFFTTTYLPGDPRAYDHLSAGDLDGNNYPDYIAGTNDDLAPWFIRYETYFTPPSIKPPLPENYAGGVNTGLADFNADGFPELFMASGPGSAASITICSGSVGFPFVSSTPVFGATHTTGLRIALGDVNGDGKPDQIAAQRAGGSVRAINSNGGGILNTFTAFTGYTGDIGIASVDLNGDSRHDIVTSKGGAAPQLRAWDANGYTPDTLFPLVNLAPGLGATVSLSGGDLNGDGKAEIIAGSGAGAPPRLQVINGQTGAVIHEFSPFETTFTGGVGTACADFDSDGLNDIWTARGPGGAPQVRIFSGVDYTPLGSFNAFAPTFTGGVYVSAANRPRPKVQMNSFSRNAGGMFNFSLTGSIGRNIMIDKSDDGILWEKVQMLISTGSPQNFTVGPFTGERISLRGRSQ